jgi:hypothetical protein
MVIAARPFKRILGEREETRPARRLVSRQVEITGMGRSTMTKRRRRWLRRLTIGVSFAAFAAPASAQPIPAAADGGMQIVAVTQGSIIDRTLPPRRAERATVAVRPDDRADRFARSDAASPATSVYIASVSWDGAVTLGLGTLVLVLSLGFGLGYIRRPRIAGL